MWYRHHFAPGSTRHSAYHLEKNGETTVSTHMSLVLPESVWEMYRKEAHLNKTEKVVYIICWDTKWNRNASGSLGLFNDVVRILKRKIDS